MGDEQLWDGSAVQHGRWATLQSMGQRLLGRAGMRSHPRCSAPHCQAPVPRAANPWRAPGRQMQGLNPSDAFCCGEVSIIHHSPTRAAGGCSQGWVSRWGPRQHPSLAPSRPLNFTTCTRQDVCPPVSCVPAHTHTHTLALPAPPFQGLMPAWEQHPLILAMALLHGLGSARLSLPKDLVLIRLMGARQGDELWARGALGLTASVGLCSVHRKRGR